MGEKDDWNFLRSDFKLQVSGHPCHMRPCLSCKTSARTDKIRSTNRENGSITNSLSSRGIKIFLVHTNWSVS